MYKRKLQRLGAIGSMIGLATAGALFPATAIADTSVVLTEAVVDDAITTFDAVSTTSGDEALSQSDYEEFATQLLETGQVAYVARDGSGGFVVGLVDETEAEDGSFSPMAVQAILADAEAFANVEFEEGAEFYEPIATNDVVGGAGLYMPQGNGYITMCSAGFPAWTGDGQPALLFAGHCGLPGEQVGRLTPKDQPYAGGNGPAQNFDGGIIGYIEWSEWHNNPGTNAGNQLPRYIDMAGVRITNGNMNLRPMVTNWSTGQSNDLSLSGQVIRKVGKPYIGQTVHKSGRTSGHTTSVVRYADMYSVIGGHIVHGFETYWNGYNVDGGDSGGAVYSGDTALGIVSGGADNNRVLFATLLEEGLQQSAARGYSLKLHVDEPYDINVSRVGNDIRVTGKAPAGKRVTIARPGVDSHDVGVDGNGNFSRQFAAGGGQYEFHFTAFEGYNRSVTIGVTVNVPNPPGTGGGNGSLPAGTGTITAAGLCLDVPWGNSASGTKLQVVNCNGNVAQNFTRHADGTITILGKCVDASNNGSGNGTAVQLWDCNNSAAQKWSVNGSTVRSSQGLCLDATDLRDGALVHLWQCHGGNNQNWVLNGSAGLPTGSGKLKAGDFCLDVPWGNPVSGEQMQVQNCHNHDAQNWTRHADGTIRAYGKCLDVAANNQNNGTNVILWDCNGGDAQKWTYDQGTQALKSVGGFCLDVWDPLQAGAKTQLWSCHGGANQRWTF